MNTQVTSYYVYGLQALQERLPALAKEIDGVRAAEDIEYVHRMRVASRRVRNTLALFSEDLPRKHYGSWRIEMRRVTRALGAARDTDVQIAAVLDFWQRCTEDAQYVGLERLLLRLRQQRAGQQSKVLKATERLENKRILDAMRETLEALQAKVSVDDAAAPPPDLYQRAGEAIHSRLDEFLAFEEHVAYPERADELHQMRIAAKHLRYTLEVFAPLYDRALRKMIKIVKEIQGLLGEMHDCDVWLAFIPQFIEEEHARTLNYLGEAVTAQAFLPGLHALEADRSAQRLRSYYIFQRFWELTREQGVWENLREMVAQSPAEASTESGEVSSDNTDS